MIQNRTYRKAFIFADALAAALSWIAFFIYRKFFIESELYGVPVPVTPTFKFYSGVIFSVCFWFLLHYSTGYYKNVLRKSILENFIATISTSFIGVVFIFFTLILDDTIGSYRNYYESFFVLFGLQTALTFTSRIIITNYVHGLIRKGKIVFKSLLIGHPDKINQSVAELEEKNPTHGRRFIGVIPVTANSYQPTEKFEVLGSIDDIHTTVVNRKIDDVLVILDEADIETYRKIITLLNHASFELFVNAELYPLVKGKIELNSVFREPFFKVSRDFMPSWQILVKQFIDVFGSLLGLILSIPFVILIMIIIKATSKGPVIYSHERIGQYGRPFKIYKFRSMYSDAETDGPQLASKGDPRITKIGRFMRRLRIDEIPNFYNVLRGDMSLVGPRPERKFYIDQIVQIAPKYNQLLQVKPGVTSLGQVKYGYAENVDEMVRRMKYDLLYLENMSIYTDIQIMARTLIILFKGRGV